VGGGVDLRLLDERSPVNDSVDAMIRLSRLNKSYPMGSSKLHVLKGIDLSIAPGELVAIMGASGSGKSTLLNVLGLLDGYDDGDYYLDGQRIGQMSETKAAGLRASLLGFVFQSFNLIPFKTAVENVALPLYYQAVPRRKRNKLAEEYLDRVGLADRAEHLPRELSGGQQQRVAIARALISNPKVILADEPTGALDSQTSLEVMEVLREINATGVTLLIVTHEREVAARTRRVIRLRDGRIEGDGPPESAFAPAPLPPVAFVPASPAPAAALTT
jgi:putative ABC transport system ATP-binding protein